MHFEQLSDGALLAQTESLDQAYAAFYRRHVADVLRLCARRRIDATEAADIVADTFMAAFVGRRTYRDSDAGARPWLIGIAERQIADHSRRKHRQRRVVEKLCVQSVDLTETDRQDYAELTLDEADALAALAALPPDQQAAVYARVIIEEDYSMIGKRLGVTEASVRKRVSRGLSALRRRTQREI
jgi:RNA polymerase sigma factor (sigma-70 family)